MLYPGNDSIRWAAFGGRRPTFLQFTDRALIAGNLDANAFRVHRTNSDAAHSYREETKTKWLDGIRTREPRDGAGGGIAGVYRESKSPLRPLGEGPVNTCAGFAWTADGLAHAQYVKQMAEEGHTPSIALLMEVASALDNPAYPDRQEDAKLAQVMLAGVSKTKRAAATKDIAAWLEAEAAQQDGS